MTNKKINWLSGSIIYPELHFVLGYAGLLTAMVFLHGLWLWTAFLAGEVGVFFKEGYWDSRNESHAPFFWNGATDAFWYQVGFAAAAVVGFAAGLVRWA